MRCSQLFSNTLKDVSSDEKSINAKLLTRGGFVDKTMAGVYTYLPLGFRVLHKIEEIVREEMVGAGAQEVLMPALQPKESWESTGRWDSFDALFKVKSHYKHEYALGPTHEEVITPLAKLFINSYRDLPRYVFQIQTKFRDEARAKSGILRGREFLMKDLYSFHGSVHDLESYYETMKQAYQKIFARLNLDAKEVHASGGSFSEFSHEYQVVTEFGEDTIYVCDCGWAENSEISKVSGGDSCPSCGDKEVEEKKSIEVANIFTLHDKFSKAFDLNYTDESGKQKPVVMGCYGIGISRLMGAIVEVHHDENGIVWPDSVAPFDVHVVALSDDDSVISEAESLVGKLDKKYDVLYDDRGLSAGESLHDADLIGIPWRVVVSKKSLEAGGVEVKGRSSMDTKIVQPGEVASIIKNG